MIVTYCVIPWKNSIWYTIKVEEFRGDLDCSKWLNEQNSAPENKSSEKMTTMKIPCKS